MLSGRYPSDEFAELRPRIVWDRSREDPRTFRRPTTGGRQRAPSRPWSFLREPARDGKKVRELDEEMVYEMRPGEVFILGATSWRRRHHAVQSW